MSDDAAANDSVTGHPHVDRLIDESRAWLAARGETIAGSGAFQADELSGWLHADFGPQDQDKGTNQDYVLAWRPAATANRRSLRLVLAMADGLTTSFRSEYAAALACWMAVRAMAGASPGIEPLALAKLAFNEAGLTIGQVADQMARNPQGACPEGQFLSTWKYILAKGALLQTTLTVAWLDRDHFRLAAIGDGGAVWREYAEEACPLPHDGVLDRVLARCDLESQHVHCLGPADRCVQEFDSWCETLLGRPFLAAIHTDGIGRGLGQNPVALLDDLERLLAQGAENPARRFIKQAIAARPKDFADNLTLAVLRAG